MTWVQTLPQLTGFFCRGEAVDSDWGSQKHGLVRWVVITEVKTTAKKPKGGLIDEWKHQRMVWLDEWKHQRVVWLDEWKPQRVVWLAEQKPQKVVWLQRLSQRSRQNCKNLEGWSGYTGHGGQDHLPWKPQRVVWFDGYRLRGQEYRDAKGWSG